MVPDVSRGARDVGHVKFSAFRCRDQAHTPIRVTQSVPHTSTLRMRAAYDAEAPKTPLSL